jgi:hypothetical protein
MTQHQTPLIPEPVQAYPCGHCGSDLSYVFPGSGPHAGKLACANCRRFIRWVSQEFVDNMAKRSAAKPETTNDDTDNS